MTAHLQSWHDVNIVWDPSEFENVSLIYIPANQVWIPELYLYHRLAPHSLAATPTLSQYQRFDAAHVQGCGRAGA